MCGYGLLMSNVGDFAGRSSTGRPLKNKNEKKKHHPEMSNVGVKTCRFKQMALQTNLS